ncbi:MAG: hypothetical protein HC922_01380 [Leptolyngbyaceae cyanobacterium SM2_3_12]|nr:hypothetical protein [Leptolyngbyaceae cyanobacterium SM2_3_12]
MFGNAAGVKEDTPLGQKLAAATIQRDIDYGEFDASLDKYKPAASLSDDLRERLHFKP